MQGALIILLLCSAVFAARGQQADATRQADSLTREWETMWRRSDSLRVEAMFLRMRADSLRRATARPAAARPAAARPDADTATQGIRLPQASVPAPDASATIDSMILRRARQGKIPRGITLSDSLTARRLAEEPEEGVASYYAEKFHGRLTSSGERFNMHDSTCAHRWLPFGTKLRVTNLANERSVIVRVNDRGPWKHGRILDVSKGAAVALDMIRSGTARVRIEVVTDTTTAPAE